MIIISSFSISVALLIVNSVSGINIYESKPRDNLEIEGTSLNVNRPPVTDDDDITSVTLLPDNKERNDESKTSAEDISIKSKEGTDEIVRESAEKIKISEVSNENFQPESRSVQSSTNNNYSTDNNSTYNNNNKRRRLQQVKKTKLSNIDAQVDINKSTSDKEKEHRTVKASFPTSSDKPQTTTVKSQKRSRVRPNVVPIIESENYVFSHKGNFHYSYEGGDGTKVSQTGEMKTIENGGGNGEAVIGSYSYTDKDGNEFSLSYTADENGYRPVGAHLPTPPPTPPEIQAALRILATKTTPEPITERVTKS